MSPARPRTRDYLGHMLEAIERIERYAGGLDEVAFAANVLVQDAVIRNLEVLGEAARNIARDDPPFAAAHPQLPLLQAYEMRNALAHGYFKVDTGIVWRTIVTDLVPLRIVLQALVRDLSAR